MRKVFLFLVVALVGLFAVSCSMTDDEQNLVFLMTAEDVTEGEDAVLTIIFDDSEVFGPVFYGEIYEIVDGKQVLRDDLDFFQYGERLPLGGKLVVTNGISRLDIPGLEKGDYMAKVTIRDEYSRHTRTSEFSVLPLGGGDEEKEEDGDKDKTEE